MPTYSRSPRFMKHHGGKGRATFRFGAQVHQGEPHVEWLGVTADDSLYRG